MKVLIDCFDPFELWTAPAWMQGRLEQDFPQLQVVRLPDSEGIEKEFSDTDILIGWSIPPAQFVAAQKLRWIHTPTAGVDQLLFSELIRSNVVVTNSCEVHGSLVAEHAMGCLLALAKGIPQAVRHQTKKEWAQQQLWRTGPRPREISGATVVVVGMGSVGREFTTRAKAFGMRVLAVRQNPEKGTAGADAVYGAAHLEQLLPEADYVLLCVPTTQETIGLMSRSRLNLMKPDAYLINVGRGALLDEAALFETLSTRRIAGAALDVFKEEPLPPDSNLWSLNNLLITPNVAAVTERIWNRHYELIRENMARFLADRPLLNQVNKHDGY